MTLRLAYRTLFFCSVLTASILRAEQITYTFSGADYGVIGGSQTFSLTTDGFISSNLIVPVVALWNDAFCGTAVELKTDVPLSVFPEVSDGQEISFADLGPGYFFAADSFTTLGVHNTVAAEEPSGSATLTVTEEEVPEPSPMMLLIATGSVMGLWRVFRAKANNPKK